MNIKVYYRSPVIWNMILFIAFSFVFIYFQHIFKETSSITEKFLFKNFVEGNLLIVSVYAISVISFFKNNKHINSFFYLVSVTLTFSLTTYNLLLDFSKFSLILLFFYLLIAFYLYQFYIVDIAESYYNPQYEENALFKPMLKEIKVDVLREKTEVGHGYLTNWSKEGCFVYFSEKIELKGPLNLKIHFLDREFEQNANIVSTTKSKYGYGFKFKWPKKEEKLDSLGWEQFYEIIDEMGLKPELLK